jgi:Predicted sugar isomerase
MTDAFSTDVRPLLAELREETGLDPDPLCGLRPVGLRGEDMAERVGGTPAGWGS